MANVEEITSKNTKAEIFEALQAALKREKELSKIKSDPIKEETIAKNNQMVEKTKVNVEQKIFSDDLVKRFKDLEDSIAYEENRLKLLYGVEKEMQDITIAVNAGKDVLTKLSNERKEKEEELTNRIKNLEDTYKLKSIELQKEFDEKSKTLKVERERENEEYTYNLKRNREKENNKWEDEKTKREVELSKKEEEINELLNEATNKSKYIKELEEKVASIPNLLEKEYKKGCEETTQKLTIEYSHEKTLASKDYEYNVARLNDKIDSLKEELSKLNNQNTKLQEKLDNAYIEIKELATKTVESASGVKIIGNNTIDGNK